MALNEIKRPPDRTHVYRAFADADKRDCLSSDLMFLRARFQSCSTSNVFISVGRKYPLWAKNGNTQKRFFLETFILTVYDEKSQQIDNLSREK